MKSFIDRWSVVNYCKCRPLQSIREGNYSMKSTNQDEFPKLSRKEMLILEMLVSTGEMFGLEMVEASDGSLKRGTIYVTLQRMWDKNYVESREEPRTMPEIGIPRRKYKATGLGEMVYRANVKALEFFNINLVWRESN